LLFGKLGFSVGIKDIDGLLDGTTVGWKDDNGASDRLLLGSRGALGLGTFDDSSPAGIKEGSIDGTSLGSNARGGPLDGTLLGADDKVGSPCKRLGAALVGSPCKRLGIALGIGEDASSSVRGGVGRDLNKGVGFRFRKLSLKEGLVDGSAEGFDEIDGASL